VLLRALQYAATYGYTVWLRPQELFLGKGVAASGPLATRLGLRACRSRPRRSRCTPCSSW
jgi:hypothetical protein